MCSKSSNLRGQDCIFHANLQCLTCVYFLPLLFAFLLEDFVIRHLSNSEAITFSREGAQNIFLQKLTKHNIRWLKRHFRTKRRKKKYSQGAEKQNCIQASFKRAWNMVKHYKEASSNTVMFFHVKMETNDERRKFMVQRGGNWILTIQFWNFAVRDKLTYKTARANAHKLP